MFYQKKYLKYKNKYLKLKNYIGGNYLHTVPKLCFGTAQFNLDDNLKKALEIGIRHIDGADNYGLNYNDGSDYLETIKNNISIIPRE
jgi:diketogulonate reductase-like aldo/keto reductase